MEPVRTCLGCRERSTPSSLSRCVERNGEVVVDGSATLPGRGAWVHPNVDCVDSAIRRRAFGRALRAVGSINTEGVRRYVITLNQSESPDETP